MGRGGTVQVNTSCQSVRFSRRPRPPLPVGINLTLRIHPHPPPHTHRAITSPHSHLPSTFKEFTLKQHALLGLPLALGWAPAPQETEDSGLGGGGRGFGTETDQPVLLLHHLGRESWHTIRRHPASLAQRCCLRAQHHLSEPPPRPAWPPRA
ncbi:hypothetical protein NQZ68_000372 [Dissostichus eleginoides]|nr:hypothetical protein NQZ68_000372 [Dissostichus eleginoides]